MKTIYIKFFIAFSILFTISEVHTQNFERTNFYDAPEVSSWNIVEYGDNILFDNIGVDNTIIEMDRNGKKIKTTKINRPPGAAGGLVKIKDNFYFVYEGFGSQVFKVIFTPYNYETNTFGKTKLIVTVPTESDPAFGVESYWSPNENTIGYLIPSGKSYSSGSGYSEFKTSNYTRIVFDKDLNVLWEQNTKYEFDEKEYQYHYDEILDDDGTWYSFGRKIISKKGPNITSELMVYVTTPDGATTGPHKSEFNVDKVNIASSMIKGDKIVFFGLWGNESYYEFSNGTFYTELDKNSLKTLVNNVTTLSMEDGLKFTNNNFAKKQIEKGRGVYGFKQCGDYFEFKNGIVGSVFRREAELETGSGKMEAASILVILCGPKPEDMKNKIIRLNQEAEGTMANVPEAAFQINNTICVIFNDNKENAEIIDNGEPALYKPLTSGVDDAITSIVMIDESGNLKRQTMNVYQENPFTFEHIIAKYDNGTFIIKGFVKPVTGLVQMRAGKKDEGPKWYVGKVVE